MPRTGSMTEHPPPHHTYTKVILPLLPEHLTLLLCGGLGPVGLGMALNTGEQDFGLTLGGKLKYA